MFYREFRSQQGRPVGENYTPAERMDILIKIYNWAKNLPHITKTIAQEALDEILQLGIKINRYDKDMFIEYLKSPSRSYSNPSKK